MSCKCKAERRLTADAQCLRCAQKHLAKTLALLQEFSYEEANRGLAVGELVLAADHLKVDYRPFALRCREAWRAVQDNREHELNAIHAEIYALMLEEAAREANQ